VYCPLHLGPESGRHGLLIGHGLELQSGNGIEAGSAADKQSTESEQDGADAIELKKETIAPEKAPCGEDEENVFSNCLLKGLKGEWRSLIWLSACDVLL